MTFSYISCNPASLYILDKYNGRKTNQKNSSKKPIATILYENLDIDPAYVEGAQGIHTPQDALHVKFYSEYLREKNELKSELTTTNNLDGSETYNLSNFPDPYGLDIGNLVMIRKIQASLIMTLTALRVIVPWLKAKLDELEKYELNQQEKSNEPAPE